jgi:hypothetical protein
MSMDPSTTTTGAGNLIVVALETPANAVTTVHDR